MYLFQKKFTKLLHSMWNVWRGPQTKKKFKHKTLHIRKYQQFAHIQLIFESNFNCIRSAAVSTTYTAVGG